jgi:hypothetical protein
MGSGMNKRKIRLPIAASPRTERELKAMLKSVIKKTVAISPKEVMDTSICAGIMTRSGKLTKWYDG